MFTNNFFYILLFEGPVHWIQVREKVNFQVENLKTVWLMLKLLEH